VGIGSQSPARNYEKLGIHTGYDEFMYEEYD